MNASNYLKDLSDGIIVLDHAGTIIEVNPSAIKLLSLNEDFIGKKYADIISANASGKNDAFHQVVLDSVLEYPNTCRKKVSYHYPDGTERLLQLTSSLHEENGEVSGLILTITDITETTNLMKLRERSSYIFMMILIFFSGWILLYAAWEYAGRPIATVVMSWILIYSCFALSVFTMFYLKLKPEECGLRYKGIRNVIITDCFIAAGGVLVLILLKMILRKAAPEFTFYCRDNAFFDFTKYKWYSYLRYILSVFAQEFISRGIIHEQTRIVITSKHKEFWSIVVSSMIFSAAHVHWGLIYMLGAAALLGVLGVVYRKQGTILGLLIPHYILGLAMGILGFVQF